MITNLQPEANLSGYGGPSGDDEQSEPGQLALFELPAKTCLSCHRLIHVGTEATHLCMFLD